MTPSGSSSSALTDTVHWDHLWREAPRLRLPSGLLVTNRNLQRLLSRRIRPGMRVLEVGCAPGKMLAWVASECGAEVTGMDLSETGLAWSRKVFDALSLRGEFVREDLFDTTLPEGSFDFVYSFGLIEHFDDPGAAVRCHLRLVRPGGSVLCTIPNFSGFQGAILRRLAPDAVPLHNLRIMSPAALRGLAPDGTAPEAIRSSARAWAAGRLSLWHCGVERLRPRPLGAGLLRLTNAIGLLQPFDLPTLCPLLVLEIERGPA